MKPISKTAFYTAGIRMLDSRVKRPICNDILAHVFMNDEGMAILNQTRHMLGSRITTVQRHKIIDDILNELLQKNNSQKFILIGAGFDTRAYRLPGGNWIELDEPEIITYKDQKLPALQCPNPLQRIAIQFAQEPLIEKLRPFATQERVVIIYEGVMMYLNEKQINENIKAIQLIFPHHLLICDLITRAFFYLFSRRLHRKLSELGASFQFKHHDKPQQFFTQKNYKQLMQISIPQTAIRAGNLIIPRLIYFLFKNVFITGYTVNLFEYLENAAQVTARQ